MDVTQTLTQTYINPKEEKLSSEDTNAEVIEVEKNV